MAELILRPNAAGTLNQINTGSGATFSEVDDISPDDDTTYIARSHSILGGIGPWWSTFNITNPLRTLGVIDSVQVSARSRRSDGTGGYIFGVVHVGGTLYVGDTGFTPGASYTNGSDTWTTNPDTSQSWTWDDIASLEIGVEHQATGIPANFVVLRTTQIYATVSYTLKPWDTAPSNVYGFHDSTTAIKEYLEDTNITDSNVSGLITYLANVTFSVDPREYPPDRSKTQLGNAVCHLWPSTLAAPYLETVSDWVNPTTRLIVWVENSDPVTAANSCQAICGAISSAIQQTKRVQGADWPDFYCNVEPTVRCDGVEFIREGQNAGLCEGRIFVDWNHVDS